MAWSLTNLFRRRFLKPAPRKPIRRSLRLALERLEDRLSPASEPLTETTRMRGFHTCRRRKSSTFSLFSSFPNLPNYPFSPSEIWFIKLIMLIYFDLFV